MSLSEEKVAYEKFGFEFQVSNFAPNFAYR